MRDKNHGRRTARHISMTVAVGIATAGCWLLWSGLAEDHDATWRTAGFLTSVALIVVTAVRWPHPAITMLVVPAVFGPVYAATVADQVGRKWVGPLAFAYSVELLCGTAAVAFAADFVWSKVAYAPPAGGSLRRH
ncbi:drug/metabolite transporter superfamily protein YnfA [Actinopolyspora biskrensis]|uniref:Drug/metabolite transporter superfamily protein YnfA n=1 Tax=Actinopolyspora biskrensis TaxID=1470178 RepID=A0A852Z520_9ACTN|nr:hypothetical protein [Actinopolyspora biskrensis]NYH77343.1 drug/metabolite transporter superfamily protein YnfA [Actinopolyspora biskrensis]